MSNASHEEQPPAAEVPAEPVAIDLNAEEDEPAEQPPADDVDEAVEDAAEEAPAGEEPCTEHPLPARIEALLISTDRPLTNARLGALLGLPGKGVAKRVAEAIEALNEQYESTGRAFRVERLAGGWQVLTRSDFGELLTRLHRDRMQSKLSQPALETLSIIAYRQPIIRAEIESIRGVSCGEVLRGLLERRLVKIVGRAEELGRPMLYGTTREFLKVFGLPSLGDLPKVEGLKPGPKEKAAPKGDSEAEAESDPAAEAGAEDRPAKTEGAAREAEAPATEPAASGEEEETA